MIDNSVLAWHQAAKKLLQEYNAKPVAVIARYACGYSNIGKPDWWDTATCGGPIVEQATHFIDLMRYFGGEVAPESIQAVAVGPGLPLSDMPPAPAGEHTVSIFDRVPCSTSRALIHDCRQGIALWDLRL